jgi:hypothetical protein
VVGRVPKARLDHDDGPRIITPSRTAWPPMDGRFCWDT